MIGVAFVNIVIRRRQWQLSLWRSSTLSGSQVALFTVVVTTIQGCIFVNHHSSLGCIFVTTRTGVLWLCQPSFLHSGPGGSKNSWQDRRQKVRSFATRHQINLRLGMSNWPIRYIWSFPSRAKQCSCDQLMERLLAAIMWSGYGVWACTVYNT